ncbi:MAG: DMT family transporter [Paracoccaceae bacterium]|nr:DMT family transporter [Paracoccaceae bacterium]
MTTKNGILLLTIAMLFFAIEDTFIKLLTGRFSQWQIIAMLGLGGSLVFGVFASLKGRINFRDILTSKVLFTRSIAEAAAAAAYVISLSKVDLLVTAAVFQATPLAITFGAAVFLKEDVGWRRWSAIIVGFIGVLIIIRPGLDGFQPASLWSLLAVAAVAARDLLTRSIPSSIPSTSVAFFAFFTLMVIGGPLAISTGGFQPLSGNSLVFVPLAVLFGTGGYYAIVAAMRSGDVSAIMPFRYTRLIFSIMLGMLVFSESLDLMTVVGSFIIIVTGLFTFWRERIRQR